MQMCHRQTQVSGVVRVVRATGRSGPSGADSACRNPPKTLASPALANSHQDFHLKQPVHYQRYRKGCGRDARLGEIWGDAAGH